MRRLVILSLAFFLALSVIVVGVYFFQPKSEEGNLVIPDTEVLDKLGLELEYSAIIDVDGVNLSVYVADTQETRERGLSGILGFAQNEGVLFVFEDEGVQEISIKDIEFSVDVLWLDYSRAIIDSEKQVRSRIGRRSVNSGEFTRYAIVMSGGWLEDNGTHRGIVVTSEDISGFASLDVPKSEQVTDSSVRPIPPVINPDGSLPSSVLYEVPFTPQAVFGDWDDIRQSNACEEASALMAYRWALGQDLSLKDAEKTIIAMSDYELATYGHFHDTSAQDTVIRIFNDYLKYDGVSVRYDIGFNDIRNELALGNLVIVPADGRKLGNPYYTAPGPPVHMLVVIGYDDAAQEFITNDPGTKRGKSFRYGYRVLENAVADYKSGDKEAGSRSRTAMIVVSPEQGDL